MYQAMLGTPAASTALTIPADSAAVRPRRFGVGGWVYQAMLGTPAASTALTIPADSAALRPSGFSQLTILPALAAAMAISAWVLLGLTISMRSISGDSTTLCQSVS